MCIQKNLIHQQQKKKGRLPAMQEYKHNEEKQPLSLFDYLGAACFVSLGFLPFSRDFWSLLFGA
jgi:hypothetical protein